MEQLNFMSLRNNDWAEHFLIQVMTARAEKGTDGKPDDFEKLFQIAQRRNEVGDVILEVELKVNGVEVSAMSFIKVLEDQFTQMVNDRARELLKENMSELTNTMYKLSLEVERAAQEAFPGFESDR